MDGLSGVIGTMVASAATLVCSTVCCAAGIYTVAAWGTQDLLSSRVGVLMVLLGLLVWIIPPLVWSIRGRAEEEDLDGETRRKVVA